MKLYTTIHKLPLQIFIDIIVDEDLKLLIIEGEASEEVLNQTWQNILNEYTEAVSNKEVINKIDETKNLLKKETTIKIIDSMLRIIEIKPCEELFNLLYLFNYPISKLEYSEENLKAILPAFLAYYKKDRFEYQLLIKSREEKGKGENKDVKLGYDYFNNMITEIGIAFSTSIDITKVTTGIFCTYVNKLHKHYENQKKQQQKKK